MAAVRCTVTCDWCEETEEFLTMEDWFSSDRWWTVEPPSARDPEEFEPVEDLTFCSKECLVSHLS